VPGRALERDSGVVALRNQTRTVDEVIQSVANRFGVSRYVVLRRLLAVGIVGQDLYRRTVDDWNRAILQRPARKARGGPPPAERTVAEIGRPLIRRVLDAHDRGQITDFDVSDLLSVRLKHIEKIQALVAD
jgi:Zn-dependent peptidase ImmA (M78 family)